MTTRTVTIEEIADVTSTSEDESSGSHEFIQAKAHGTIVRSGRNKAGKRVQAVEALNTALSRFGKQSQRLVAIVGFLLIWEIAPTIGLIDTAFVPPPSVVFSKLAEFVVSGTVWKHLAISLQRAFSGYTIAILTAVPIGFLVGWYKTVEKYLDPLLQTLRQMPILALFPVFILFLGIGEKSKAAMVALACFWSIFLNTESGVSSVDPLLVKTARAMNVSAFSMFWKVVLPAAVPSMFTGFRYAGTVALLVLVSVEMIGADSGLGYWVMNAEQRFSTPEMFAGIVTLTVLGVAINYSLEALEKRMTRWKEVVVRR